MWLKLVLVKSLKLFCSLLTLETSLSKVMRNGDDNVLDEDYFPQETAGEIEIHGGEFDEDEIDGNISKSSKWKKTENLSLRDVDPLTKSDEIVHATESSMFDFFAFLFR